MQILVIFVLYCSIVKAMSERIPSQQNPVQQQVSTPDGVSKQPPAFQLKAGEGDVVQKRDKDRKQGQQDKAYTTHIVNNTIITVPKNASGNLPIAVIYGGLIERGGSKENMKSWTPESYFSSHILAFADYFTGFESSVRPGVKQVMEEKGITGTFKSLLGFSKGAERVRKVTGDESWSTIGLIDPSVWGTETYPGSVYMVWDKWGKKTELKDDPRYKLHMRIQNGDVSGQSKHLAGIGHSQMPAAWFSEFGGNL